MFDSPGSPRVANAGLRFRTARDVTGAAVAAAAAAAAANDNRRDVAVVARVLEEAVDTDDASASCDALERVRFAADEPLSLPALRLARVDRAKYNF